MEGRLVAGRYRLIGPLGRGAMGAVWLCEDQLTGRQVAVKELRPPTGIGEAERDVYRRRALAEARSAARLAHPTPSRCTTSSRPARPTTPCTAGALGIVHRDIKPANIVITAAVPVEITQQVRGCIAEYRHRRQCGARIQATVALDVGGGDCAICDRARTGNRGATSRKCRKPYSRPPLWTTAYAPEPA
jgi:hypothetical protein